MGGGEGWGRGYSLEGCGLVPRTLSLCSVGILGTRRNAKVQARFTLSRAALHPEPREGLMSTA